MIASEFILYWEKKKKKAYSKLTYNGHLWAVADLQTVMQMTFL